MEDPAVLKEFVHWVPTPILALGFWWLLKRTFNEHELRFSNLVARFEGAIKQMQQHDTSLTVLERDVRRHENELNAMRERQHDMAEELHILMGRDGSGPKRDPRSGHHNG